LLGCDLEDWGVFFDQMSAENLRQYLDGVHPSLGNALVRRDVGVRFLQDRIDVLGCKSVITVSCRRKDFTLANDISKLPNGAPSRILRIA
jgi:hypothetical protein